MSWKKIQVKSHSNIALIKYWGKVQGQFPMNPSLSFTLKNCQTVIDCNYERRADKEISINSFAFAGKENAIFKNSLNEKIKRAFSKLTIPFGVNLELSSHNSFPHSAGIASSASSMAAMANCFAQIFDNHDFQWISSLARELSGSAARSVTPGWFCWGKNEFVTNSSQDFSVKLNDRIHPTFNTLQDWIFVCSKVDKKLSSTSGHTLMEQHPYRDKRINNALSNFDHMLTLLKNKPTNEFFELIEKEALELHALMMTSNPPHLLITSQTVGLIHCVQKLRREGIPCGFTLDAGATLHFLFLKEDIEKIQKKYHDGFFGIKNRDYVDLIQDECCL